MSGLAKVEDSLRVQSILMTGVRMLRTLLTIAIPIVLVRVLAQSDFGTYKQIVLISTTALGLLSLGLPASLFYFIPRQPERSQVFITQTALVFALTSAIGGLLVGFNPGLLERWFGAEIARFSLWGGILVALSLTSLLDVLMVVDRRVRLAAASSAALDAAHGVLVVLAALITRNLTWVFVAISFSLLLRVFVLIGYIRWRAGVHPAEDRSWTLRQQFGYAMPFFLATLVATARDQLHAFFVAANYDAVQFAIYAVGTIQLPLVNQFMQSIGETIVLENSKNYATGQLSEMRRVWHRATYFVALVMLPLFFIMEFFATDAISFVFGARYAEAAGVWRVFVFMLPLTIMLGATMLRATGDLKRMIAADVISLGVTVATLLLFAKSLGILAAVLSIVVGNAALNVIVAGRVINRFGFTLGTYLQWGRILTVALVAAACAATGYFTTQLLPLWARIFVGPGIAGIAYFGITWAMGLIPESERKLLLEVLRRIGMRLGLVK